MLFNDEWQSLYFDVAKRFSEKSKDQSKVGAVLVSPDKHVAAAGFNGFPPKMNDNLLTDRRFKNTCIIHAEENAILRCKDAYMEDYTMFVYGLHPCPHCASIMAIKGIKTVYSRSLIVREWEDDAAIVLKECGIEHIKENI